MTVIAWDGHVMKFIRDLDTLMADEAQKLKPDQKFHRNKVLRRISRENRDRNPNHFMRWWFDFVLGGHHLALTKRR